MVEPGKNARMPEHATLNYQQLIDILGKTDVYLLDQVMKGRYLPSDIILDAGCGHGRNIDLFIRAGFRAFGVDRDPEKIAFCRSRYPAEADQFSVRELDSMAFEDNTFHHIISSAVFHFCASTDHFHALFAEHVRVLKPQGTIFIRMTSLFGMPPGRAEPLGNGIYRIPDYGDRFMLTHSLVQSLTTMYPVAVAEPVKTVNVMDQRAMAVLILKKL